METKTNETTAPKAPRKSRKVVDTYVTSSSPPEPFEGATLSSSKELFEACADFRGDEQENFYCFEMDGRGRVLARRLIGKGTVNQVIAQPVDIFRQAIRNGTHVVALVHNHPAGDPTPSHADKVNAARIKAAGDLLGIPVVDQLVVSAGGYRSIHEELLKETMPRELEMLLAAIQNGAVDVGLEVNGKRIDLPAGLLGPTKPKGPTN